MALGQMRQSIFQDSTLTLFQSAINDQFSKLSQIPILNGTQVDGVVLAAGNPKTITHGLQRVPKGLIVVSTTAASSFSNQTFNDASTLVLTASVSTTVSLWVY